MNLQNLLKKWRTEEGLTLEQLAEKVHLSPQALSYYENGKRSINIEMFEKIAKALNKEVSLKVRERGEIPLSEEQKRLIKDAFFKINDTKELYDYYLDIFDIKKEEVWAGKIFDDMDVVEYIRNSPDRFVYTEKREPMNINIHSEEVILFYRCMGGEYHREDEYSCSCTIPYGTKEFVPPRRTSRYGFITEQRRELLKVLKETFEFEGKHRTFNSKFFKKRVGI